METRNPLSLESTYCRRGPEDRRPILYIPHPPGAQSVLLLKLGPGLSCEVGLPARYRRPLLILARAWLEDEGEVEGLRGFRTAAEIGECFNKAIGESAVKAYIHEIRARISREVYRCYPTHRGGLTIPKLLESRRMLGYRIGPSGLEIQLVRPRVLRSSAGSYWAKP